MKAVLVGTDLMYRKDGKLVPIEINTNVGWDNGNRVEPLENIWDLHELVDWLQQNSTVKSIVMLPGVTSLMGPQLYEAAATANSQVCYIATGSVDDADDRLIVRVDYSDEALVDSFCRDKIAFLKSIQNTEIGCEYLLKTSEGFEGNISSVETEYPEGIPNFILKCRYPTYDKKVFPKLFRFNSVEKLLEFAKSDEMPEDYFLVPYYFCKDKLWKGSRISLVREWSLFIANGEKLDCVNLGHYTKLCGALGDPSDAEYSGIGELDESLRSRFLSTDWYDVRRDLEFPENTALLEENDLVWMSDGFWKKIQDLKVGETVRSLGIYPISGNVKDHKGVYGNTLKDLEENSNFEDSKVLEIRRVSSTSDVILFRFDDETEWYDTGRSSYPILNSEEVLEFKEARHLEKGDRVLLVSTSNVEKPEYLLKTIKSVETVRTLLENGYSVSLDGSHLFISRTSENDYGYAAIEHNASSVTCNFLGWVSASDVPTTWLSGRCPATGDHGTSGFYYSYGDFKFDLGTPTIHARIKPVVTGSGQTAAGGGSGFGVIYMPEYYRKNLPVTFSFYYSSNKDDREVYVPAASYSLQDNCLYYLDDYRKSNPTYRFTIDAGDRLYYTATGFSRSVYQRPSYVPDIDIDTAYLTVGTPNILGGTFKRFRFGSSATSILKWPASSSIIVAQYSVELDTATK